MSEMATITYRGFYDVPRILIAEYKNRHYLFSCPFDERIDEYPAEYQVYLLPRLSAQDLEGNWEELHLKATQHLGKVPVSDVRFDSTRRRAIDAAIIENLLGKTASEKSKEAV